MKTLTTRRNKLNEKPNTHTSMHFEKVNANYLHDTCSAIS